MQQRARRYAQYTLALLLLAGCGSGLAGSVQCRLDALRGLPDDPLQITVFDAIDLGHRLHSCRTQADGGAQ